MMRGYGVIVPGNAIVELPTSVDAMVYYDEINRVGSRFVQLERKGMSPVAAPIMTIHIRQDELHRED